MAVNVLVPLLIPLGEQLTNVTKLVGSGPVEFDKPVYLVEVKENSSPQPLAHLTARVQAQGAPLEFRIAEGNDEGVFTLDPSTGRLGLTSPLDYEHQQQYDLVVEARAGEARSEARVVVRVVDENDHTPVFPRLLHETQITEEDDRHLPKVILTVRARDGDGEQHSRLRYSLTGDGVFPNGTSSFDVDPLTGAVLLLRPLDRDPPHGQAKWHLRVTASDGELSGHTDVQVNLKDVNDNSPFFPTPVLTATISESTPMGAPVIRVVATDHDDPGEGQNAQLLYSLEKNVIDEATGSPIFTIDTQLGLISTALCCLDREKTQRYAIQVVATDGGGLKGTGTVVVDVEDINDVPPRFSRPEWTLDVSESHRPERVLATLTVVDQDVTNNFTFRVVPESGHGWQMFLVEGRGGGGPGGDLRPLTALDFENPDHRLGFRFRVEVTDEGEEGWGDKYHVDGAWVNLRLLDENDNTPTFVSDHAHLTLPEDTPTGTQLATFTAHDLDGGGRSRITYAISPSSDAGRQFGVDEAGAVRLVGGLDRETVAAHSVLVWAVDDGVPPRTATATLSVNVTDVNDNPPFLAEPREVEVVENGVAQVVARVRLGDADDWRQGHGPPFTLALDPRAPPHIATSFTVTIDKRGDEGRGIGVVSTVGGLDREESRLLLVPLLVGDAGSVSATLTLTVHVADLNDNPMAPASKTVTVHTVKHQKGLVPLGRVYVQDPDDWDASAKTYAWRHHQSGFFLSASTGALTMAPNTPDGRYELGFWVSDASQGQSGVMANVTVEVKSLTLHDVTQATPLTLAVDPYQAVSEEAGQGGSSLVDQLAEASRAWIEASSGVWAWVNQEGVGGREWEGVRVASSQQEESRTTIKQKATATRVWVVAPGVHNLGHILLYRRQQLAHALGVDIQDVGVVACQEPAHNPAHTPGGGRRKCLGGCWSQTVLAEGYSVVDSRTSALVGPRVHLQRGCGCRAPKPTYRHTCTPHTCLNGGRCVPTPSGTRCICPYGTWGSRCKVLSRYFEGAADPGGGGAADSGGWAWVEPVPACAEVHLSLEVLTASPDGTLLYSGPQQEQQQEKEEVEVVSEKSLDVEETTSRNKNGIETLTETKKKDLVYNTPRKISEILEGALRSSNTFEEALGRADDILEKALRGDIEIEKSPMKSTEMAHVGAPRKPSDSADEPLRTRRDVMLLEVRGGRPSLLLDLGGGAVTLSLNASYTLADNTWHRIDLIWKDELVEMIVDLCSGGSLDVPPTPPSIHAHTMPPDAHTCRGAVRLPKEARMLNTDQPLQVGGLAHPLPAHTLYGWPAPLRPVPFRGCIRNLRMNGELVDLGDALLSRRSSPGCAASDCLSDGLHCGLHGRCQGSPRSLRCECQPGWHGQDCATPTTPATFLVNSYVKLALSFTPLGYTTTITLRFRTRRLRGQLVGVSSKQGRDSFSLQLLDGQLCVQLQFQPDPARSLCLARAEVTDGHWHSVTAARHGSATFLGVDDGDGDLYNASVSLEGRQLLEVDTEEGVHVGGAPEYSDASILQIHSDYHDGCIDDLRLSGRSVPLPPAVNRTAWGEVGAYKGVEQGCGAPPACSNVTCSAPLSCVDTWRSYHCGCGEGRVLSTSRATCDDLDECVWQPCLNGGSCFNTPSGGYTCACGAGFSGQHCQMPDARETSLKLSLGALVAILVWCAFLLLLICAFLLHQHHKRSALRRGVAAAGVKEATGKEAPSPSCPHTPNLLELQLLKPPRANGQPAWTSRNPNIADVDVLQVDAASVTSSMEEQKRYGTSNPGVIFPQRGDQGAETPPKNRNGVSRGGAGTPIPGDDLRNYAYEGEGSSPGSLSSCLESCSGSAKFLGGFREVAHMLES
ncbi:putative neural-cadherin 2 [Procambarus clarkii]|uniref:putative neural-cadherin 2 n=1 Tax=Procambarus clarkii TaxID=6728 RepID=UPI0037448E1E